FQNGFSSHTVTNAGPTTDWPDALRLTATSAGTAGNLYRYVRISTTARAFQSTDLVEYDVWVADNKPALGGIDISMTDGTYLRATPPTDQNGLGAHPATDLTAQAVGKWYHRRLPLAGLAVVGKTSNKWDVVNENDDVNATYTAYYDNLIVATKPGACDGANTCKIKAGAACGSGAECASGVCSGSVCQ
ncbi:MAG: hypothetical protein FJ104_17855, partial [Deltaproteobacteria bacterium]|nr:hypothetical protein [Deltaproteobacteria bacterium]